MKIERYSESQDHESFLERFTNLPKDFEHNSNRPLSSADYELNLINLFSNITREFFIVSENDKDIGRILVAKSVAKNDRAIFGMVEYDIKKKEALKLLLSEAENWAIENSAHLIYGPIDINIWFNNRYKVEGFEKNYYWEPHTPIEYYKDTLELGYKDYKSFFSKISSMSFKTHIIGKLSIFMANRQGWRIEKLDFDGDKHVEQLYDLNKEGFSRNDLYEDITFEQYRDGLYQFIKYTDYQYSYLLFDKSNKLQGYSFCILDQGNLLLKSIVLRPEARGLYFAPALVFKSFSDAYKSGIRRFGGACIREGNTSARFFKYSSGPISQTNRYKLVNKILVNTIQDKEQ